MIEKEDIGGAAPLPWSTLEIGGNSAGGFHLYILDANGRKIAAIWGKSPEKSHTANLIVEAVNALEADRGQDASIEEIGAALAGAGLR